MLVEASAMSVPDKSALEMLEHRLEILFLDLAQVPGPAVTAKKPRRKLEAPEAKRPEVADYLQRMRSDLEFRLPKPE